MEAVAATRRRRSDPSYARDHLNLAEFPISVLQRRQPLDVHGQKVDTIVYRSHRYDTDARRSIPQTVTLTAPSSYGLPTPADETVVLALLCIAKQTSNFANDRVHFTPRQVFALIGWSPNSRSYDRLRQVLRRLKSLTIVYENAWWDSEGRQYEKEFATGIIASYKLVRQVAGPRSPKNLPASWIRWDPEFFESLGTNSIKRLDLELLLSLQLPTTQRLYRFLDKHFHYKQEQDFDLRDLACGHVGLSASYDTGKLKEKLTPAITELEDVGYIKPATRRERYRKLKPGVWRVHFDRSAPALPTVDAPRESEGLAAELVARGVTRKTAAALIRKHPAQRVAEQIELLDWHLERRDAPISKNPAGWLVKAIRDDYQAPPDFKTAAERAAEAELRREKTAAKRRQQQEEEARLEAERREEAALDRHLDQLPHEEREEILATVLAANDHYRKLHRKNPESPLVRMACRQELKRRLVQAGDAPASA